MTQKENITLRYEVLGDLFVNELSTFHKNEGFSDVFIWSKEKGLIKAHCALLASSSRFLRDLLKDTKGADDKITLILPDFTSDEILCFLRFLYTGETVLNSEQFLKFQHLLVQFDIDSNDSREIILEDVTHPTLKKPQTLKMQGDLTTGIDECTAENTAQEDPHERETIPAEERSRKPKEILHCYICQAEFSTENKLNDHILKHENLRPYKCNLCSRSYPLKASLTAHMRMHNQDKPHQCEQCGKAFLIRSLLEQHLRTHTNERPYTCDVCGKAFRNKSNLLGHRKTHASNKPHVCHICQRKFSRKHDLDAHVRIHTGDRPFLCSACPKAFRFSSALRVHLKRVHDS